MLLMDEDPCNLLMSALSSVIRRVKLPLYDFNWQGVAVNMHWMMDVLGITLGGVLFSWVELSCLVCSLMSLILQLQVLLPMSRILDTI